MAIFDISNLTHYQQWQMVRFGNLVMPQGEIVIPGKPVEKKLPVKPVRAMLAPLPPKEEREALEDKALDIYHKTGNESDYFKALNGK